MHKGAATYAKIKKKKRSSVWKGKDKGPKRSAHPLLQGEITFDFLGEGLLRERWKTVHIAHGDRRLL